MEEKQEGPSVKRRTISYFDQNELEMILGRFIDPEKKELPILQGNDTNTTHCYDLRNAFSATDSYWINQARIESLKKTVSRRILYRPAIVNEIMQLVDECWNQEVYGEGIMIKGPHGVGKSHSIVNLVHKLLYHSNGKYLVTFVPNCQKWTVLEDLYNAICGSFGTTMDDLDFNDMGSVVNDQKARLMKFIKAIDSILAKKGMKWIFIFDQINRLFARPEYKIATDLGVITFPFSMIQDVIKKDRIISIVSASANNEPSFKENHPGFVEYNHPCNMSENEINLVYLDVAIQSEEKRKEIYEVTGGVPLQVSQLITSGFSIEKYQNEAMKLILTELRKLRKHEFADFEDITTSAVACILSLDETEMIYDRKYSIAIESMQGSVYHYKPLFPMVVVAYRKFFWNSLLTSLADKESLLLQVCKTLNVTNDTRGRLFELIVINRCSNSANVTLNFDRNYNATWEFPSLAKCSLVMTFASQVLPTPSIMKENGMYVPINSNFPAIDLIWKCGNSVCGVQIHVAAHNGTTQRFESLCTTAEWFETFDKVYMLYLSPTKKAASLMQQHILQEQEEESTRIHAIAASIHNVSCLANLPW